MGDVNDFYGDETDFLGIGPLPLEEAALEEVLHEEPGLAVVRALGGRYGEAAREARGGRSPLEFPVAYDIPGQGLFVVSGRYWIERALEEGRPFVLGVLELSPEALEQRRETPAPEGLKLLLEEAQALKRLLSRALSRLKREKDLFRAQALLERIRQARGLLEEAF